MKKFIAGAVVSGAVFLSNLTYLVSMNPDDIKKIPYIIGASAAITFGACSGIVSSTLFKRKKNDFQEPTDKLEKLYQGFPGLENYPMN